MNIKFWQDTRNTLTRVIEFIDQIVLPSFPLSSNPIMINSLNQTVSHQEISHVLFLSFILPYLSIIGLDMQSYWDKRAEPILEVLHHCQERSDFFDSACIEITLSKTMDAKMFINECIPKQEMTWKSKRGKYILAILLMNTNKPILNISSLTSKSMDIEIHKNQTDPEPSHPVQNNQLTTPFKDMEESTRKSTHRRIMTTLYLRKRS